MKSHGRITEVQWSLKGWYFRSISSGAGAFKGFTEAFQGFPWLFRGFKRCIEEILKEWIRGFQERFNSFRELPKAFQGSQGVWKSFERRFSGSQRCSKDFQVRCRRIRGLQVFFTEMYQGSTGEIEGSLRYFRGFLRWFKRFPGKFQSF